MTYWGSKPRIRPVTVMTYWGSRPTALDLWVIGSDHTCYIFGLKTHSPWALVSAGPDNDN
ncbi:Hypothetical protein FKW44_016895 [Caligus rogercresseyi]|uniref:Uncharacterized protein n=1 Tax=Caligus rogercresseyi TaxID=217165 RepID=A0A7T8H2L9_CALRO|nr:Hypothetical protein FKW44_016895 [Caligus rogercresseyi]